MGTLFTEQSVITSALVESQYFSGRPLSFCRRMQTKMLLLVLPFLVNSVAVAEVRTTVYLSEPNMVLEPISDSNGIITYPEIMVGTKLVIVVDSNEGGRWDGGLFVEAPYIGYGVLSGRGYVGYDPNKPYDPNFNDWLDSHYPAAGPTASVYEWPGYDRAGFTLYTGGTANIGDWFVIDYTANDVGPCTVRLYSWDPYGEDPNEQLIVELAFTHTASRDFDGNSVVDFGDLAILTSCWDEVISNPEGPCAVDLNDDTLVDFLDFSLFADFWLERTEY